MIVCGCARKPKPDLKCQTYQVLGFIKKVFMGFRIKSALQQQQQQQFQVGYSGPINRSISFICKAVRNNTAYQTNETQQLA